MPTDQPAQKFYITTPIYYVNDRPHIGHVYTTTIADVLARYHRLRGDDVFFLTGTDEHAAKVVDSAAQRSLTPQQWADQNAKAFQDAFKKLGVTNDDFIRTTQDRHKTKVRQYVKQLLDSGDVYLGEYEGWYDAGQEEYVPESRAKESDYKSPINGKPLVRKKEKNYFFKLSKYADELMKLMEDEAGYVEPKERSNEVIGRLRDGLKDVPISRTGSGDWGIKIPGDDQHAIYVWIDALFNYYSAIDTDDRRKYWPANVHLIAKDILWFHAVIWPALLIALKLPLPGCVYAHSFWISEGQKMSKSLGNFIDLEKIDHYVNTFSLDAFRYFLASNGPIKSNDSDFSDAMFVDVYNSDLANTIGNCFSRITNMTTRYFGGKLPGCEKPALDVSTGSLRANTESSIAFFIRDIDALNLETAMGSAGSLVQFIDGYIEEWQPFKLAKDPANLPLVGSILYNCAEAMRIASLLLWPVMPNKCEEIWRRLGCDYARQMQSNQGRGKLADWLQWGLLQPGTTILQGDPLFPRYQPPK